MWGMDNNTNTRAGGNVVALHAGKKVHDIIWHRRISQEELGAVLGKTGASISRKLRGQSAFTLDEIYVVAEYLQIDPRELLPGADEWRSVRHVGLEPTTRWFGHMALPTRSRSPLRIAS